MSLDRDRIRRVVSEVVEERWRSIEGSDATGSVRRSLDEPDYRGRELITERDVAEAHRDGRSIVVRPGALITPAARDAIGRYGVRLEESSGPGIAATVVAPAPAKPATAVAALASSPTPAPASQTPASNTTECKKGLVAIAADHGGYEMKQQLIRFLEDEAKIPCSDLGTHSTDPVDYPDFARLVAEAVAGGRNCRGIVIDGAGIGSSIAANKINGVRAAHCTSPVEARNAREHNDANVLCLGGRMIGIEVAKAIAILFMKTDFAGGRHQKRVDKIIGMER